MSAIRRRAAVGRRSRLVKVAALLAGALVVSVLVPLVSASAAPTRYEAENATVVQGVVEANHLGFSGTGFVNYNNVTGSYVPTTVNGGPNVDFLDFEVATTVTTDYQAENATISQGVVESNHLGFTGTGFV